MQEKSNIANCDRYKLTSKNAMFKKLLHDRNHTLKLANYLQYECTIKTIVRCMLLNVELQLID